MNCSADEYARVLWDYHQLHHTIQKADVMLCLGSNDVRVADYAAKLFLKGLAPVIVFSGGFGRGTKGIFEKTEASLFAEQAIALGVSSTDILIEEKSTNSSENIRFSKELLNMHGIHPKSLILIQKPYMERRAYATCKKQWPEAEAVVTSPHFTFESYPNEVISKELLINIMVGDLERIIKYPEYGFQIAQDVPQNVLDAYEKLIALGYTTELMNV